MTKDNTQIFIRGTREIAHVLGIGENEVARLARRSKLPCLKAGQCWLSTREDLAAWARASVRLRRYADASEAEGAGPEDSESEDKT
jgi:hypothetical protein